MWLNYHGCPWNEQTYRNAAANGHSDVLLFWASSHERQTSRFVKPTHLCNCPWNKYECIQLAKNNKHFKIVDLLEIPNLRESIKFNSWSLDQFILKDENNSRKY